MRFPNRKFESIAEQLIQVPTIANKRWIYHQYDSMVGTVNASTNNPSDAPVVVVKETGRGIAVTVDCNSRYVYADPYKGAMIAVAEAARNIVCSGGQPLGCYQLPELRQSLTIRRCITSLYMP
jgi:phosphoribosylformylglycinamidine (FGAM) synthase-like enzyme